MVHSDPSVNFADSSPYAGEPMGSAAQNLLRTKGMRNNTVYSVFSIPGDRNMRIRSSVRAPLKIKVDGVFCVFLDEGLARLDLLAH